MDETPMRKLKVTFTVTGTVDWQKLKTVLEGLSRAESITEVSGIWIEETRPVGRPAVNQQAILDLLSRSKKPLSNAQMSRKLDIDRRAIYNACRVLVRQGSIENDFDEKWKVKRWRLPTQA